MTVSHFPNSARHSNIPGTANGNSNEEKMRHVLDAIESDGRGKKVTRNDGHLINPLDTNDQHLGYRKILSKKMNTLSTVHTDMIF